ncbi:MAG: hypothetical protein SF182_04700 [Deltaproteobacteria bacterium]|nr:hypothetical protein [Deltaproteobacteria bacterium]
MSEQPAPAKGSSLATIVAVLLAIGLTGAVVYIGQLRAQLNALQAQLATQTAQLKPFLDAARAAYPDADAATALGSIAQRLAARPAPAAPAAAVPAAPVNVSLDDLMSAEEQQSALQILRNELDTGRKLWLLVAQNNGEAIGSASALQTLFEQAGWPVETVKAPYPIKAGVFLLAGDEDPPQFVSTVSDALNAGGLDVQYLTGYRAFVSERRGSNPNWVGPDLAADQPFTLVVGAKPKPKEAAAPAEG